jgi:hypothetical protein
MEKYSFEQIIIIEDKAFGITTFAKMIKRPELDIDRDVIYLTHIPDKPEVISKVLQKEYPNTSIVNSSSKRYSNIRPSYRNTVEEKFKQVSNSNEIHYQLHYYMFTDDRKPKIDLI